MKPFYILFFTAIFTLLSACESNDAISLFNGKDLSGWNASENKETWSVQDGVLVTHGARSHLFYTGDVMDHNFKNFELNLEVKAMSYANSGIYVHTEYQETGWPEKGYECQVINARRPSPDGRGERKMTGSIYAIRNTWKSPVKDNEWFDYRILVQGKTIQTFINGELICEYTEPDNPYRKKNFKGRLLSSGTIALQGHDPGSEVHYRNIRIKPLPDDLPTPGTPQNDAEFEKKLIDLAGSNFPLMDLHVHAKGGLTVEDALANARKYGFTYGLAVNCGLKMGFESDAEVMEFVKSYKKPGHTWLAMQAEGREWLDLFSKKSRDQFDYVFTDAMTWTNDNGKRMRLWIPEETEVGDPQDFMDQMVDRLVGILNNEPIQIYVNSTYLPDDIMADYDALWTEERMDKVIQALAENKVALEINNRRRIPSVKFLKRAKAAGVKFTFGTNNSGADDLGRMEYAIEMIDECNLKLSDMWFPEK